VAHGRLNILIADDDEGDRKQLRRALEQAGLSCECVETRSMNEAQEACDKCVFDCAIVDYRMPGYDGLHGIAALHQRLPHMPIIMATGQGDERVAAEAMKRGASDYIPKSQINKASIRRVIENALDKATLRRKVAEQREDALRRFAEREQLFIAGGIIQRCDRHRGARRGHHRVEFGRRAPFWIHRARGDRPKHRHYRS
jgi:DNA-binding NtrC family response regulator